MTATEGYGSGYYGAGFYGRTPYFCVKLILTGGPLDGESELVEMVPTDPGSKMFFNLPHWQTFDSNGNLLFSGLETTYVFVGPGPAPDPMGGDIWLSSWIFTFEGSDFLPSYPPGAMFPDLDYLSPGTGPVGESTKVHAEGSGFLVVTAVYMPTTGGAVTQNPVPSFEVIDDNNLYFDTISASAEGSYDLSMAYTDQIGNSATLRWAAVFQFTTDQDVS